jgi:hypothetical protein
MKEIKRWFGWFIVVLLAHLAEQFMFGLDELQEVKRIAASYYTLFQNPDVGTVILVGAVVAIVQLMLYATLLSGRGRLLPFAFFGVSGIGELHHVVKTILHAAYFPGAVTAVVFAVVGWKLLRAVGREWHASGRKTFAAAA